MNPKTISQKQSETNRLMPFLRSLFLEKFCEEDWRAWFKEVRFLREDRENGVIYLYAPLQKIGKLRTNFIPLLEWGLYEKTKERRTIELESFGNRCAA